MSKILILTASPQRDKLIDGLLKERLEKMGNEVKLHQVPVGARKAILDYRPDVLVAPPIRNYFAFDLLGYTKRCGAAIVIRHIEPSCDKEDLENMSDHYKTVLAIGRPDNTDLEMFWSDVEIDFLESTGNAPANINMVPIGAFVTDIYKNKKICDSLTDREGFNKKHNLDNGKETILISAPWGLVDSDSDNMGQSAVLWRDGNQEAVGKWLNMATELKNVAGNRYNLLATLHPLVPMEKYKQALAGIGIEVDVTTTATELLLNIDYLIHAGSTMAMEMHWLDKPAFQFGDVNSLDMPDGNWWQRRGTPISQVSPFFLDTKTLIEAIDKSDKSNANESAIKKLEEGRYGKMDGKATERAAKLINDLSGKFEITWPPPAVDQTTIFGARDLRAFATKYHCRICEETFHAINQKWFDGVANTYKDQIKGRLVVHNVFPCPWCGSPVSTDTAYAMKQQQLYGSIRSDKAGGK
jgi:hypothetical protein